jgi:putative SOS response-associated peptidase YedK
VPKPIKRVFAITTTEAGPFAFAGIWDAWKRPDGTYLETFAIVTTEPNELVAQIHDRLALILHPRDYDRWLGIDDRGGDPRPPFDLLSRVRLHAISFGCHLLWLARTSDDRGDSPYCARREA